uniref:Uncharacterized protein n=1 Tax=uncultured Thiotrichaceae bacterium TaxID=298394 RepID=A0A6S6U153_9GAMM|nr:MAG: Unknown protein [uncultured Thiotrichaceae bacterium]
MSSSDQKETHLQLIQDVVKRMADNSFKLKAWTTALVTAILALAGKADQLYLLPLAGFVLVVFWFLDAYFLRLENLYRGLYNHVRVLDDVSPLAYDLNPYRKDVVHKKSMSIFAYVFSLTLGLFYGFLLVAVVAITVMVSL